MVRDSVVLAWPNQLVLIGIRQVLEATDRFEVVSQAHASALAPALARQRRPDHVVLDGTAQSNQMTGAGLTDTVHELFNLTKPPGLLATPDIQDP